MSFRLPSRTSSLRRSLSSKKDGYETLQENYRFDEVCATQELYEGEALCGNSAKDKSAECFKESQASGLSDTPIS